MSTTVGNQVTAVSAAIRQAQQQCAARGRSKSLGGSASAVWGVPTATDVALEVRIAGIAAALREALQARGTLMRDWKIGQLQLALIAAVRMRSAAQIVRLMMRTGTVAAAAGSGGATGAGDRS